MTPKYLTVSEKGTDALPISISKESGIERAVDILLEEIIMTSGRLYGESDAEDRTAGKMNRGRPKRRFMDAVKERTWQRSDHHEQIDVHWISGDVFRVPRMNE